MFSRCSSSSEVITLPTIDEDVPPAKYSPTSKFESDFVSYEVKNKGRKRGNCSYVPKFKGRAKGVELRRGTNSGCCYKPYKSKSD